MKVVSILCGLILAFQMLAVCAVPMNTVKANKIALAPQAKQLNLFDPTTYFDPNNYLNPANFFAAFNPLTFFPSPSSRHHRQEEQVPLLILMLSSTCSTRRPS